MPVYENFWITSNKLPHEFADWDEMTVIAVARRFEFMTIIGKNPDNQIVPFELTIF